MPLALHSAPLPASKERTRKEHRSGRAVLRKVTAGEIRTKDSGGLLGNDAFGQDQPRQRTRVSRLLHSSEYF